MLMEEQQQKKENYCGRSLEAIVPVPGSSNSIWKVPEIFYISVVSL
jgi:hypothetical protein